MSVESSGFNVPLLMEILIRVIELLYVLFFSLSFDSKKWNFNSSDFVVLAG